MAALQTSDKCSHTHMYAALSRSACGGHKLPYFPIRNRGKKKLKILLIRASTVSAHLRPDPRRQVAADVIVMAYGKR
jgi:hypothetical protein